jgi:hypothetical protein
MYSNSYSYSYSYGYYNNEEIIYNNKPQPIQNEIESLTLEDSKELVHQCDITDNLFLKKYFIDSEGRLISEGDGTIWTNTSPPYGISREKII